MKVGEERRERISDGDFKWKKNWIKGCRNEDYGKNDGLCYGKERRERKDSRR